MTNFMSMVEDNCVRCQQALNQNVLLVYYYSSYYYSSLTNTINTIMIQVISLLFIIKLQLYGAITGLSILSIDWGCSRNIDL